MMDFECQEKVDVFLSISYLVALFCLFSFTYSRFLKFYITVEILTPCSVYG
jgi:hypothetical protein